MTRTVFMVKSTVRFPEQMMEQIEQAVDDETFTSKSEFQRFAVEYLLSKGYGYEPKMTGYEEIREEVISADVIQQAEQSDTVDNGFYKHMTQVHRFATRGEIETAREYIDTQYAVTDPRRLLLDEFLAGFTGTQGESPTL